MRLKTCKACGSKFKPERQFQVACSWQCAIEYSRKLKEKRERKLTREAKERIKTRATWMREAQAVFNRYIRFRDADKPCVSCGRVEVEWTRGGAWDCGHYLSRGSHPELRFEELNAAKQCKKCNGGAGKFAKKNMTVSEQFRIELIERIGLDAVKFLEGPHEPKKYTIDDLKAIKAKYTLMAKELQKEAV